MPEGRWVDALQRHDVSPDSTVEVLRANANTRDMTIEISQTKRGQFEATLWAIPRMPRGQAGIGKQLGSATAGTEQEAAARVLGEYLLTNQ